MKQLACSLPTLPSGWHVSSTVYGVDGACSSPRTVAAFLSAIVIQAMAEKDQHPSEQAWVDFFVEGVHKDAIESLAPLIPSTMADFAVVLEKDLRA